MRKILAPALALGMAATATAATLEEKITAFKERLSEQPVAEMTITEGHEKAFFRYNNSRNNELLRAEYTYENGERISLSYWDRGAPGPSPDFDQIGLYYWSADGLKTGILINIWPEGYELEADFSDGEQKFLFEEAIWEVSRLFRGRATRACDAFVTVATSIYEQSLDAAANGEQPTLPIDQLQQALHDVEPHLREAAHGDRSAYSALRSLAKSYERQLLSLADR